MRREVARAPVLRQDVVPPAVTWTLFYIMDIAPMM